ncbi:MAG: c-type cytochrome [Desulfuromonadaceae bacterium]|nr:c-type cytochrome [Desulfuromonadaceae bacterium]
MTKYGALLFRALIASAILSLTPIGADAADGGLAETGEAIFHLKCSGCHTIGGGDLPMGPDLAGVTELREQSWIADFIRDPGKMIAAKDPVALELVKRFNNFIMPRLGITEQEIEALLAYLAAPQEAQHHAAAVSTSSPMTGTGPVGDPRSGEALFVGTASFAKGGAPCLACHGIAGAGLGKAAAANFGPDLTPLWENFGEQGVLSVLKSLPFPSMIPIYATRPLTSQEQLDLAAFFAEVSGRQTPEISRRMTRDVLIAGGSFLGLIGLLGWRRLSGVRQPLLQKSRQRKVK